MFRKKKRTHEFASTDHLQMNVSTLSDSTNMGDSSSNASSLSRANGYIKGSERKQAIEEIQEELGLSVVQFKTPLKITTYGAEELTDTRVSTDSLNSFGSASSMQRIIMNGKTPRDFSKINIQKNYDAQRGSDYGINQINGSFGIDGSDSGNQEDSVLGSNNQRVDLSKSIRDVIRNNGRSQPLHARVTDTPNNNNKTSSRRMSKENDQNKKTTGVPAYLRACIFFFALLLCAAGIGVLIHFLRNYESQDMANNDTATCIAYGVDVGKNSTMVCNTTFKYASNISISMNLPMSAQVVKLTSLNPYSDGWRVTYTSKEDQTVITLIGPPANCSSGGLYTITITNTYTNSSIQRKITLDVNIYATISAGNVTLDIKNYNCSSVHCESYKECKSTLLYIYRNLPPESYCCNNCFDFLGCTANCSVTTQSDISNSTIKCSLMGVQNITAFQK